MQLGNSMEPDKVRISKACELVKLLLSEVIPFVEFLDAKRKDSDHELILIKVRPEVPNHPVNDIRFSETIAIEFDPSDKDPPRAIALRSDFPRVPHTYFTEKDEPLSLCLFDEIYSEQKLRWTASSYLKQLFTWLSKTATGTLHQSDQPVDPFLLGTPNRIVLPSQYFELESSLKNQILDVLPIKSRSNFTFITHRSGTNFHNTFDRRYIGLVVDTPPQTHGTIVYHPENLLQLQDLMTTMGADLFMSIKSYIKDWITDKNRDPEAIVLIILRIPIRRSDDDLPERVCVHAFHVDSNVQDLGKTLGLLGEFDGTLGAIVGEKFEIIESTNLAVIPLNPIRDLSCQHAQILTGTQNLSDFQILSIGAGSLGSQVLNNLIRGGFGTWTIIDNDTLLPHNLIRHSLPRTYVGSKKSTAFAHYMNSLYEDGPVVHSIDMDVLDYPSNEHLSTILETADICIDFSASLAVARWLALDATGDARRISVFLNPQGTDVVLMAEDQTRLIRLDHIEPQYYRALIVQKELTGHLQNNNQQMWYGRTCRDVTSFVSQDLISIFSGIASSAIKDTISNTESRLDIWQTTTNQSVSYHSIELAEPVEYKYNEWQIISDKQMLSKLFDLRQSALPNETGGVLIGYPDHLHKILYVVDALPSPRDSEEWPTSYIRGCEGLNEKIDVITQNTAGVVGYLGEWHSHPDESSCKPSQADNLFLSWLEKQMFLDGMPGLMAIVCDNNRISWHIGSSDRSNQHDD